MRYNIYLGQIVKAPENSEAPKQKVNSPGANRAPIKIRKVSPL